MPCCMEVTYDFIAHAQVLVNSVLEAQLMPFDPLCQPPPQQRIVAQLTAGARGNSAAHNIDGGSNTDVVPVVNRLYGANSYCWNDLDVGIDTRKLKFRANTP